MKKKIIDGNDMVVSSSIDGRSYIRIRGLDEPEDETIKISEMEDNEEVIITGKQLKELQQYWKYKNVS